MNHCNSRFVIVGNMDGDRTRTPGAEAAEKVVQAAADLLSSGGIEAVSTRAVAAAAGVQPPTIYRQFGDKQGLLDAVTGFVLQNYLKDKRRAVVTDDPVQDLRDSWDLHVDFGLTHPDCYILAYVQSRPGRMPSRQQHIEQHAQGIDVGGGCYGLGAQLLGSRILRRHRPPAFDREQRRLSRLPLAFQKFGNAKV